MSKQSANDEPRLKIRVSFGVHFSFEADGREDAVKDAYQRALEALVSVTPKSHSVEHK